MASELELFFSGVEHLLTNTLCLIANRIIHICDFILMQLYAFIFYEILGFQPPGWREREAERKRQREQFEPKMLRQRQYALNEIISSEYTYQQFLTVLVEVYEPEFSKFLTDEQIGLIFKPLLPLISASQLYVSAFEEECKNGAKEAVIGPIFRRKINIFETFSPFIPNYMKISTLVQSLTAENRSFRKTLEKLERTNEPFSSLIVMPVQRMPRYSLLLREVLKATPEWHRDHRQLKMAIRKLEREQKKVDKKVREVNRRSKLLEIETSIRDCPKLLDDERRFIATWPLRGQGMELFLFTDLVLVVKNKTEGIMRRKIKEFVEMQDLNEVNSVVKTDTGVDLKTSDKDFHVEPTERVQDLVQAIEAQVKALIRRFIPVARHSK